MLANEPMPTWWPSISTVVVPSGDAAVTTPLRPGRMADSSRNSSRPGANSSSSGMRDTVNSVPTGEGVEGDGVGRLVVRARGSGCRAGRWSGRRARGSWRASTGVGDDVLPLPGLGVGVGPRQPEDVGEEALGQAVAAHDLLGQLRPPSVRRIEPVAVVTRPSASMRRIISDTAGRETSRRSAMRAWMTSTSSSSQLEDGSRSTPRRPGGTRRRLASRRPTSAPSE